MLVDIKKIQRSLLFWFETNQRSLPWRKTYAPYHIWISEIMLQQTQMDRGVDYFEKWMRRFPDIKSVAKAGEEEILKLWEGLGYYSRARNIRKTAFLLVEKHGGILPDNHSTLLTLPGIGRYTAGAIMSLAFNQDFPVVDANVERLFSRLFDLDRPIKEKDTQRFIWEKAQEFIPSGKARFFNQALMELGALLCLPKNPKCDYCPVTEHCLSFKNGTMNDRPLTNPVKKSIPIYMATGVLVYDKKLFIQKRPENGVWANLWEFPGGRIEKGETPEKALAREYMEETEFTIRSIQKIITIKHNYMHYRVTLHCFHCRLAKGAATPILHAAQEYRWVPLEELHNFAFPAGHRELIKIITTKPTILASLE